VFLDRHDDPRSVDRGTGLLNNDLYVGRILWNRCSYIRDPSTGKRVARPNPREEREEATDESLRIVDDALWQRVMARQAEVRTVMKRDENGVPLNRAHRARHLLSGLIYCGECGSIVRDARRHVLWLQQCPFEGDLLAEPVGQARRSGAADRRRDPQAGPCHTNDGAPPFDG